MLPMPGAPFYRGAAASRHCCFVSSAKTGMRFLAAPNKRLSDTNVTTILSAQRGNLS